jgi:uncharacterized protein with NAD-binding domain and iron-sulfur cluster
MQERHVYIVGGGLAGMCVAMELAKGFADRGVRIHILEASNRLGGKAGADEYGRFYFEHGYHVFPGWYVNTRALLSEIGVDASSLIDIDKVHYITQEHRYPRLHTFYSPTPGNFIKNLRFGLIRLPEAMLATYYTLDLASQYFGSASYLDRVSANGFLRSRWYATDELARLNYHFVLQASSIPHHEVSAMTLRKVAAAWHAVREPMFSILPGDLQQVFINPLHERLVARGVDVQTGVRVVHPLGLQGTRVSELVLEGGRRIEVGPEDLVVLATPPERTVEFVDDHLYALEHDPATELDPDRKPLSELARLKSVPMAAMHVFLRHPDEDLPEEHVVLFGSRYELSFVNVTRHWGLSPDTPALSIIASDYQPLRSLSPEAAVNALLDEFAKYAPKIVDKIDRGRIRLIPNLGSPLFLNTVGSWSYRPNCRTRLDNLWVAGDYCKTDVDLTTMEGAVYSGLRTAAGILDAEGIAHDVQLRDTPSPSRWKLTLIWLLGIGPVFLLRLWIWLAGRARYPVFR